jgi:hypothetical protein
VKKTGMKFPAHLRTTPKVWRQLKRQQWKLVLNALDDFHNGSAFTPVGHDLYDLQRLAERIRQDLRGPWVNW